MTSVEWLLVAAAVAVGFGSGMSIRAVVFEYAVPSGEPWRTGCPHCSTHIVAPDWGILRAALPANGRCPHCGERIGPPIGVVEVLAGVAAGVVVWRAGIHIATIGLLWATLVGVTLALVDLAVHRLPDRLILAATAGALLMFGVAAIATGDYRRLGVAVLCGLGCGVAYFVLVFISPRGMGLGDAKLAVLIGLTAGWYGVRAAVFAIFAGIVFAGVAALALLALRRVSRSDRLAYGPFMLLGALTAIALAAT